MQKDKTQLRRLPEVQAAVHNISRGGLPEAVVRMLILLAEARGAVRGSRLQRAAYTLSHAEPFASLSAEQRAHLIREQTLIVLFDHEAAVRTLLDLLPDLDTRAVAVGTVDYVAGSPEEMDERTLVVMQHLRSVLELPPLRVAKDEQEAPADAEPARSAAGAA